MHKAVFIIPDLRGGGAERVMSTIANYLANHDVAVTFLMTKGTGMAYKLDDRIQVIFNRFGSSAAKQVLFIRDYMKREREATYVSFLTYQNLYMLVAAFGLKVRTIVSERNDPSKTLYGKEWLAPVRNFLYSKAGIVVFQTEGAKKYFPEQIQKRSTIILNPLKKDLPAPYEGVRERTIVSVGRLTAQKNYGLLLRAFSDFHKMHPDYRLCVYGKGELEAELKDLAARLNLTDHVVFEGFCDNVDQQIVNTSMFVMSSDYEGLSNALLEAMAVGIPCISTDSPPGGARMVIENNVSGILTPVGDCGQLTKAMCFLAENPEAAENMGKEASKLADVLSEEAICGMWKKIILAPPESKDIQK